MFIHMLLEVFINTRSNLPSNFPMYAVHILCKGFNIFSWSRFYDKNHQVGGQSWTNTHEHCIRNLMFSKITQELDVYIGKSSSVVSTLHLPATSYSLNLQRRKKLQMRFLHKPK
eukprot:TRINITY_DN29247_c0_g1_i1.p1 TRINITY_DN29247_c0_g1~~TRINITY_DN29247_c0_g1_i1.p1  ORF type:complete len:114 (+),score=2.22 TRINITY_DN29247_c0_g1_i1:503-844(+)